MFFSLSRIFVVLALSLFVVSHLPGTVDGLEIAQHCNPKYQRC